MSPIQFSFEKFPISRLVTGRELTKRARESSAQFAERRGREGREEPRA